MREHGVFNTNLMLLESDTHIAQFGHLTSAEIAEIAGASETITIAISWWKESWSDRWYQDPTRQIKRCEAEPWSRLRPYRCQRQDSGGIQMRSRSRSTK